ncbi:MAG: alpha/beta fold hydrolase [Desulfobacteraceae bacterium]|nr:MAG: alpha/beta fold hydrolase [Desulfobacteraceae bacterium]
MRFQRLSFNNAQGKRLAARLDLPMDEKPLAYALFAHCFTCTKNLIAVVNINRALAAKGIAVLRFDFTGIGESEGDFEATNFSTNVSDLVAAADFLGSSFERPKLLIGHSLGGAAVIQAAARIPSAAAVATIAAPFNLADVARHLGGADQGSEQGEERTITLAGKQFPITRQFLDDLEQTRMEHAIRNLGRPLMVLHSPEDELVRMENGEAIFQVARHPKGFVSLDGADHLLSDKLQSAYVGSMLAEWARKYVAAPEKPVPQKDLRDNRVSVRTGKTGYQTEIVANGHHLIADEPIPVGGADTGPTPYDFLVAALGACTTITMRMYADRKKWPMDSAVVRLKHSKIHAEDCRQCETREGKIDFIEREIELNGDLSTEQKRKLMEIADKCPVHRTLHSEIHVESRLKAS